jgi:hypothetical protein
MDDAEVTEGNPPTGAAGDGGRTRRWALPGRGAQATDCLSGMTVAACTHWHRAREPEREYSSAAPVA